MPEYRLIQNGYVNAALSDQELVACFRNLKLLRQDAYNDFEVVMKGYVAIETLRVAKKLTGDDFAAFLQANFRGGVGPIASVVRDILQLLNGKQGHLTVMSSITMQEHSLESIRRLKAANYQPAARPFGSEVIKSGYPVQDYDLYRLASGIGIGCLGRFFLLLGGDIKYA